VCLVTSQVGSGGKADGMVEADRAIVCEVITWEELFIVDGLSACRMSCTIERQMSNCFAVCSMFAGRAR
jgi:hypothetical protein